MQLTPQQQRDFARDGYLCLKGVFRSAEIAALTRAAGTLPQAPSTMAYLYEIPEFKNWWRDPRLLGIARSLLGESLVDFFDSHIQKFSFPPDKPIFGRHLHHDAKGTPENLFNRVNTPDPDYPVIRMIVYLQDTTNFSGGLKVVPGSHLIDVSHFNHPSLKLVNVASEPGDIVIFTQRLLHSPYALRPKASPDVSIAPFQEDEHYARNRSLFLPVPESRESVVIDYAREDARTDLFIKNQAILSRPHNMALAEHLLDQGALTDRSVANVRFRFDRAILEMLTGISAAMVNGALPTGQDFLLTRLATLCRAHWECSPFYPLLAEDVHDETPATGLRLYQAIGQRVMQHARQQAIKTHDYHMNALPSEMHEKLAAAK